MDLKSKSPQTFLRYLQIAFLVCVLLYFGRTLFIPMFYGLLVAIVLYPICKWLELHKWPRSLAILSGLSIVVVLFFVLIALLGFELNAFRHDLPQLRAKIDPALGQLQAWLEDNLNISIELQNKWWRNTVDAAGNNTGIMLKGTASTFFVLFLSPVFAALFLYRRRDFVRLLREIAGNKYESRLQNILQRSVQTYFEFIKGMIIVYIIVGVLNSIGLLALGINHAVLFGFLTAVMTIIPYVGIFIAALLPISVAWLTKDSIWYPIGVIAVFAFVQYLEAYLIFPRVVASQLKVSTWATLVAIIAGGILWGVSGMILFIPFVGILKIVAENIPEWSPLNTVLERNEDDSKLVHHLQIKKEVVR